MLTDLAFFKLCKRSFTSANTRFHRSRILAMDSGLQYAYIKQHIYASSATCRLFGFSVNPNNGAATPIPGATHLAIATAALVRCAATVTWKTVCPILPADRRGEEWGTDIWPET